MKAILAKMKRRLIEIRDIRVLGKLIREKLFKTVSKILKELFYRHQRINKTELQILPISYTILI
jgi:hypothetical protein